MTTTPNHASLTECYPILVATAQQYVDFHSAQDVVHDVLLNITKRPTENQISDDQMARILRRSVINRAIDLIRHRRRSYVAATNQETFVFDSKDELKSCFKANMLTALRQFMNTLRDDDLELIYLHFDCGKSRNEIAAEKNVTTQTIGSRLRSIYKRGLQVLKNVD